MSKTIPARGARIGVSPLRHHVKIPQQNAIKRLGGGNELGAIFAEDHALDQFIDGRILDANQIARARLVGSLRTPETALLIAGRERLGPGPDDDIEIPLPKPVFVLRSVDDAHVNFHARALERGFVKQDEALRRAIVDEKFANELLAGLRVDQL